MPKKSVVNRVATQLQKAMREKGIAFLVNHGISEEKVSQHFVELYGSHLIFIFFCEQSFQFHFCFFKNIF